jgi:EAL and modified HD-GYP domain-containing signal transduction protein
VSAIDVVVGRQPVFDRDLVVVGYELLFRSVGGPGDAAGEVDRDLMTSWVLYSSMSIGLDRLCGDKTVFCNADRGLLVGTHPLILPAERTIIEINESVATDPEVVTGCRRLYEEGYLLALDNYTGLAGTEPLLELASLVKIDLQRVPQENLAALMVQARQAGVLLVAERIETSEQLHYCKALGFDYFQGYLLSRPRNVPGRALAVFNHERVEEAAALLDTGGDLEALEEIVRTEPALAYQLFRLASASSADAPRRGVRGVHDALLYVGTRALQKWVHVLVGARGSAASEDDIVATLTRARMCELLVGARDPRLADRAYTAGLISCFGALLGISIEEVLLTVILDPEIHRAVLLDATPLGRILRDVIDYQTGNLDRAVRSKTDIKTLHAASAAALRWALAHTTRAEEEKLAV